MRFRKIDVRIWCDQKFLSLTPIKPSGQSLFIYLLTNPSTNVIPGLYRAGAAAMAEELGWPLDEFINYLQEIVTQGLAKIDLNARVIFIPNAIKYNKPQSPNVITSWASHWDEITECELKTFAYEILKAFIDTLGESYSKAFHNAVSKPNRKTTTNQEQDKEQEQEISSLREDVLANASTSKPHTTPNCPHDEIIALYHEILPMLPKILIWNKTRRSHLQQRWRENTNHQNIEHWRRFFEHVKESAFLTGQIEGRDGKLPFTPDLEWLIKPNNFAKIIEGRYHGGRS